MRISEKITFAFALVALAHLTHARVTGSTNEDSGSDSDQTNNQAGIVSINGTADPILDLLDRERAAADERTEAIMNSVRSIPTLDGGIGTDTPTGVEGGGEEVTDKKKKKKKRKGKGKKKKNKGKKNKKSKKSERLSNEIPMAYKAKGKSLSNEIPMAYKASSDLDTDKMVADSTAMMADPYMGHRFGSTSLTSAMDKYFDVRDLETYLQQCTDCYEKIDVDENLCPMHSPAMELKKWANELEDVLSHGCARPEDCEHGGACCLARKAPFEPLIVRMTQMLKDVFHMVQRNCKNCDGGTDCPWSDWSPCQVTCGPGQMFRQRICPDGILVPANMLKEESMPCNLRDCSFENVCQWGSWSECTRTCGNGVRRRTQINCPRGVRPQVKQMPCKERECPVCEEKAWGSWQSWSSCSATCGSGFSERQRYCEIVRHGVPCGQTCAVGASTDRRTCDDGPCPRQCEEWDWSSWMSWSSCSVTCGAGIKDRTRTCELVRPGRPCGSGTCAGFTRSQVESCEDEPCRCEVTEWGTWSRWSDCSVTCDQGVQTRERYCERLSMGQDCGQNSCGRRGSRDSDEQTCQDRECPCETREWSGWSDSDPCSVTCGVGIRRKRRTCEIIKWGSDCGRMTQCPRGQDDYMEVACMGPPCEPCEEAEWGLWSRWSQCSATCGSGMKKRQRTCVLMLRGRQCGPLSCGRLGSEEEDKENCEIQECLCERRDWMSWSSPSPCSVTCGTGVTQRTRECIVVQLGDRCPEITDCTEGQLDTKSDVCVEDDCCVRPMWSSWSSWSSCPVTCGVAIVRRSRDCRRTSNTCRERCGPGQREQTKSTRCGPDPEVGSWQTWEAWSACSQTCGDGNRVRRRQCSVRFPDGCSTGCPGPDYERGRCNSASCCDWTTWNAWSACSESCGSGLRERFRTCQGGRNCAGRCPGRDRKEESCVEHPMTSTECRCEVKEWTPWESWTQCSTTCGQGTKQRFRRCIATVVGRDCGRSSCYGSDADSTPCQTAECQQFRYNSWQDWCPCDCRTAERSRRRQCVSVNEVGKTVSADINNCIHLGSARITEKCDVLDKCPGCVVDCKNQTDGKYQACSGCRDYITCVAGVAQLSTCSHTDTEFDSFVKKCVSAPSPSCSLVPNREDCKYLDDGKYPSKDGCDKYLVCKSGRTTRRDCPVSRLTGYTKEYDHHTQTCIDVRLPVNWQPGQLFGSGPGSPTCSRVIRTHNHVDLSPDVPITSSTSVDLQPRTRSDAPADMYYDEKHGLTPEERRKQYEMEVKEKEQRAAKDAKRAEKLAKLEKKNKVSKLVTEDSKESLENSDCVADCDGVTAGMYSSCRGCRYYVICTKYGHFRERKCRKGKEFDTTIGKCVVNSSSCKMRRR